MLKHAHIIAVLVGIIVLTPSITIVSVSNINTPCTTMQVLTDDGVPVVFDVIKKPAASSNAPVAVLIHGFSGNRKMMKMIGLALADKGVVSVLVDLRGHGDSGGFMSYVNSFDADIQAVLGELASKSLGNISRLVFIGHSMGGSVAVNMSKILQPLATVGIAPAISPSSVNITDPENLLLIISEGDTVIDNQAVINAFYESINGTGEPNIIYYAGGSEKKLFTDDYSDHLSVLYRPPVIDEIVKWVTRIVLGVEESSSINSDLIGACVFSAVIGGLIILLPFGHKILQYFRKRNDTPPVTVDIRPRKAFIYSVIGFIAASGAGLTVLLSLPFFIVSPLLFTNFVTALFLGNSIAIGVLGGVQLRRKIGKSFFKRFFNLMLTRNLIYNLIAGFILGVLLIILFYTTIGSNTTSTLSTSPVRLA
ncbi:MAG: alpha/beta hydrolase, partial [Candidatus Odinarchaeota archaeon]